MHTVQVMDKPRRVCPSCRYVHYTDPKVGVGVVVVEEGRILLVRRAMNPERGKWSLPAGYLDQGEDPKLTAAREVLEETGLVVSIGETLEVFHNPAGSGASIFILYSATRIGGELLAGDDADATGFFALAELPPLAFASTRAAVAHLLGGKATS
jgi:ADP-ribose pyrophosphatase YjhB (NUDIX family)